MRTKLSFIIPSLGALILLTFVVGMGLRSSAATSFGDPAFLRVWTRTDSLVANTTLSRSYLWGPQPNTTALVEEYAEAPNHKRTVQYFDKSRMEINNPIGDTASPYYVTNGLLTVELMIGKLQKGDTGFETRAPALIGVAGDPDDTTGPTYAALARVYVPAPADLSGGILAARIDRSGSPDSAPDYGTRWGVTNAHWEEATHHNIAAPFWDYLNQTGQIVNPAGLTVTGRLFDPVYYATGLPVTEAYWAQVKVAGKTVDVLVQAFERRVLTFEPGAPAAYRVQMGNVGQHYYAWRYGDSTPNPAPSPTPLPTTAPPTPTPMPTPFPTPTPPSSVGAAYCLPATTTDGAQACVDDPSPAKNASVTVYGRLIVGGKAVSDAQMNTTWHFKTTTSTCSGAMTGNDGVAACSRRIGNASSGYTVRIEVTFTYNGQSYTTATSFTTQ